ncbi:hypothetical protein, partial [Borreliella garinii]|uniref:hypothetical protein n=1 Tax=Borreliella garinii TaxID=29519 RepID=UPI001AEFAE90
MKRSGNTLETYFASSFSLLNTYLIPSNNLTKGVEIALNHIFTPSNHLPERYTTSSPNLVVKYIVAVVTLVKGTMI